MSVDLHSRMDLGRAFQIAGAAETKALSPNVLHFVIGVSSRSSLFRLRAWIFYMNKAGEIQWRMTLQNLYTKSAILNWIW